MDMPRGSSGLPERTTASTGFEGMKASPHYGPQEMTLRLVSALGEKAVADLLAVNSDKPGRWASGQDAPGSMERLQLADLDALMGHLQSAFTPAQARLWLEGHDAILGARPVDAYRVAGAAPLLAAIRAMAQGAFE